jgi:DNA-damage-inducible protein J
MTKTATIRARVEPDLKSNAEHVFNRLGLTTTQAITLFFKQVEMRNSLPFELTIPNETTLQTFEDTDNGKNLVNCEDVDDMFSKLEI